MSTEFSLAIIAASGGVARVVTGTTPICDKTTVLGEAIRVLFVAMPIGIMSALYVATICVEPSVSYATAFTSGVVSLNIVRFISTPQGFNMIKNLIVRVLTGGK